MSSTQRFNRFKSLLGDRRRKAVQDYLKARPGIATRAAERAGVTVTMVSKVLHGRATSQKVEQALSDEEKESVAA